MNGIDRLVILLSKLPGIGKKTASRLVYHLLDAEPGYIKALAEEIAGLPTTIKRCSVCGSFTETDPCFLCTDESRDNELLCVVERPQDVRIIEESHEFKGRFHVLGGLIAPLDGVNPADLSISQLVKKVRAGTIRELILALNPTIEGDTTALYIQNTLKDTSTVITRLASGLPVGGDLEYTDRLTLSRSFQGRFRL
jgi:recombination protein RecR